MSFCIDPMPILDLVIFTFACLSASGVSLLLLVAGLYKFINAWVFNKYSREIFMRALIIAKKELEKEKEAKN